MTLSNGSALRVAREEDRDVQSVITSRRTLEPIDEPDRRAGRAARHLLPEKAAGAVTEVARDFAQASMLLDLKRYDEAASLLARIVAAGPEDSRAWCLLAAAHLGAGRYEEAAAAASRAITLAPSDDWPYRLASIAQLHLGKPTAAISSADEACRLAPDEWRAYICLAQAQLAREAAHLSQAEPSKVYFKAAERAAVNALRLAPHEPDAHFTAGRVSYAQRRWKAARAHQERALALDPAHSGALNELGRISLHRGGNLRAARHFIQAARREHL